MNWKVLKWSYWKVVLVWRRLLGSTIWWWFCANKKNRDMVCSMALALWLWWLRSQLNFLRKTPETTSKLFFHISAYVWPLITRATSYIQLYYNLVKSRSIYFCIHLFLCFLLWQFTIKYVSIISKILHKFLYHCYSHSFFQFSRQTDSNYIFIFSQ